MNTNNLSVWELIQTNRFEDAVRLADIEYEQSQNIFPLRNKLYALMHLEKYNEGLKLSEQLITLTNGSTESDFKFAGICKWALNDKEGAILQWKDGQDCKYTDAAGGVELQLFLYFASLRTKDKDLQKHSLKIIKKLSKAKLAVNWPGAITPFILGEVSDELLLSKVSTIAILRERQLCQSCFAVAVKALEQDNIEEYSKWLKQSVNYGSAVYLEQAYYLARIELNTL